MLRETIDRGDALERFGGNEALYKKLAAKYADDHHLEHLVCALEANDAQAAYQEAHALKGVAGNLSFGNLYALAASTTEALREGDTARARAILADLQKAHAEVLAALALF